MRQALYRKYRPKEFEDIAGQIVPVKILKNAIKKGLVSHAYLFSGPRGTGKTSIAKIFAKNVNCQNNSEGLSCGKCEFCQAIENGECVDIVEIDAASNNGVDEIRELKNKINLVPAILKYKIYIIDEVHMLSIGAFNALLKTLEEPPSHVIFILATTDLHKVPSTIVSRCQCLEFKKIPSIYMVERLAYISQQENIEIEPVVLEKIAEYTDGGLRDAIGLLDKLASYGDNKIVLADFYDVIGSVSNNTILEFLNFIKEKNKKNIFEYINNLYNMGKDVVNFLEQMGSLLIDNIKAKYSTTNNVLLFSEEQTNAILKLLYSGINDVKTYGNDYLILNMTILNIIDLLDQNIKNSPPVLSEKIKDIETQVLDTRESTLPTINIVSNIDMAEDNIDNTTVLENSSLKEKQETATEKIEIDWKAIDIKIHNIFISASKSYLTQIKELWKKLNDYTFDLEIGYYICLLLDAEVSLCNENAIVLVYEYPSAVEKSYTQMNKLNEIIEKNLNGKYELIFIDKKNWLRLKNQYIQDRKNNIIYTYEKELPIYQSNDMIADVEPKIQNESKNALFNEAIALFGKDLVEKSEES